MWVWVCDACLCGGRAAVEKDPGELANVSIFSKKYVVEAMVPGKGREYSVKFEKPNVVVIHV